MSGGLGNVRTKGKKMKMTKQQSLKAKGNQKQGKSDLLKETTDIAARRVTPSEDDAITNVLYFARALVML